MTVLRFSLIACAYFVIVSGYHYYDLNEPYSLCSDYEMLIVNTLQCVARCPMICPNGNCFENGNCPCEGFYQTNCTVGLICAKECLPGCIIAGGYCASNDLCVCGKGYVFDALTQRCARQHHFSLFDRCRGRCLHGKCSSNGTCVCAEGYAYRQSLLGQLCTPICKSNCGPNAYCFLPNMCACRKKHHHYGSDGKCHDEHYFFDYRYIR